MWLTSAASAALYVPVVAALSLRTTPRLSDVRIDLGMVAGTAVLHVVYSVLLQRSYRAGEFSVVYPVARGTGPLIASVAAIAIFGERLAVPQLAGIALVVVALYAIAGGRETRTFARSGARTLPPSLAYGVATGATIAAYTLWDKAAVSVLAIAPVLYDFGRTSGQALLLGPAVLFSREKRDVVRGTWRRYRGEVVGVAILSPLAYVLVLYALTMAPVSLVAPIRESSIVIGAFMGARVFGEGNVRRRVVAAALVFGGIVVLARG